MKKILIITSLLWINYGFAQESTILTIKGDTVAKNVPNDKIKVVLNDLVKPDPTYIVEKWVDGGLYRCFYRKEYLTQKF